MLCAAPPSANKFTEGNRGEVVIRRVDAYHDLLSLHCLNPVRYPHLLESVAHGTAQSRYDILFAFPGESLAKTDWDGEDFLTGLDRWWMRERLSLPEAAFLPFRGGWFLYLGYELAAEIEPRLPRRMLSHGLPLAFAVRIPAAVIRDHQLQQIWLVAEAPGRKLLDIMSDDLQQAKNHEGRAPRLRKLDEDPPREFLDGVRRIKRYIVDGDVFQVNLSRAWQGELDGAEEYAAVYAALRRHNPAPFAGLSTWNGSALLSSSPERLINVRGDVIETRPIAGTRPRGSGRQQDLHYSRELLAHPKERAEHIMLIDLERSDLGKVCIPGTVQVDELMGLESYAHVHHIVSNIRGGKRRDVTPGQIIRAVFPGGTITGCPKVRCMEIIAELEGVPRGPYTGSFGYLNRDGDMDLNILIRTLVMEQGGISLRAGAGIVADSDPEAELAETRAKARGLLRALGVSKDD